MDSTPESNNPPKWSGCYVMQQDGMIWTTSPPPCEYVPVYKEVVPGKIETIWYPPYYVMMPEEPQFQSPTVQRLEVGVPKPQQKGGVNVDYVDLCEYLQSSYHLNAERAFEIVTEWVYKLNDLICNDMAFCNFYFNSSVRLLKITELLDGELSPYKDAFVDFQNKHTYTVMQIHDDREASGALTKIEHRILTLYNEYRTLSSQSRSLWITTDTYGMTSFEAYDTEKKCLVKHQVTIKLFPSILYAPNFRMSKDCTEGFLRKAGLSVDGFNVLVRWAGEF